MGKKFNFWGKEIKTTTDETIKDKHNKKDETDITMDSSWIWMMIVSIGIIFITIFFILPAFPTFDIPSPYNEVVDGDYTIRIYIPDCDGILIYVQYNISGQYLYDNGYGYLENNMFYPTVDFQLWDGFYHRYTGKDIPDNQCCIDFHKE